MNGNQGLEALASLCGGASKVRTKNDKNQPKEESSMMPPPSGHLIHSNVMNLQNHSLSNKSQISQQQLYQAVLSAANNNSSINPFSLNGANFHQRSLPNPDTSASGAAQQHLAYYNHIYNAQVAAAAQQLQINAANQQTKAVFDKNQGGLDHIATALAIASASSSGISQMRIHGANGNSSTDEHTQQIQHNILPANRSDNENQGESHKSNVSKAQAQNAQLKGAIPNGLMRKPALGASQPMPHEHILSNRQMEEAKSVDDRKQVKRAANRRSAQLSRKRKKQFIEELKEENDDLRRKEQILRSIPDLVVVFDSAGKLGFVSQSVSRFLDFTSHELEGTSFWNRLCDESVRLLKAAFMDALAARKPGMDTAPLGDGLWELRLVDKDNKFKIVILNGVVHFTGETPECVCSIRPSDDSSVQYLKVSPSNRVKSPVRKQYVAPRDMVQPHQSVTSTSSIGDASTVTTKNKTRMKGKNTSKINPVSDGESVISENASISS